MTLLPPNQSGPPPGPSLRLTGRFVLQFCPACGGTGKVAHEDWQRPNGDWVRGGGVVPCPECRGSKVVAKREAQ